MKQPKKLTRAQKEFITKHTRFKPDNWLCLSEDTHEYRFINKKTNKVLILDKSGVWRYE